MHHRYRHHRCTYRVRMVHSWAYLPILSLYSSWISTLMRFRIPDLACHSNADLNPASQNHADQCGTGSATLSPSLPTSIPIDSFSRFFTCISFMSLISQNLRNRSYLSKFLSLCFWWSWAWRGRGLTPSRLNRFTSRRTQSILLQKTIVLPWKFRNKYMNFVVGLDLEPSVFYYP